MKPIILGLTGLLAVTAIVHAQSNVPPQATAPQTDEAQPSAPQTNTPRQLDPTDIVPAHLKKIQVEAPVSYRTNGNLVYCTVRCQNLEQRNTVYDDFGGLPKYGLAATKNPPTVTVVLVLDPGKYFSEQQNQKLGAKLKAAETNLVGQVLQKTHDGLLVALPDSQIILVTDPPNLGDGDPIKVTAFRIGTFELSDKSGTRKLVPKFTCDLAAATDYFTPTAATEAKAETKKRSEPSE